MACWHHPRFAGEAHARTMTRFLREKYALWPPEVLIAGSDDTFVYLLRHRAELFPQVPLVHLGVPRSLLPSMPPLPADVVGVPIEYDFSRTTFKAHLDGYNFLPYFKGDVKKGPREEISYFGQAGDLNAIRWNDWKVHFAVTHGNIATAVREVPGWPVIVNLRADPYEKAPEESGLYLRWYADNIWLFVPVQEKLKRFLVTLPEYPFQQGSSLNAAGINYDSLQGMQAMKRLKELESLPAPNN